VDNWIHFKFSGFRLVVTKLSFLAAIPAHTFSPLDTRDLIFAFRTIFQKNNGVTEFPKFRAGIAGFLDISHIAINELYEPIL